MRCNPEINSQRTQIIFRHKGLNHKQDPFIPNPVDKPLYLAPRYFLRIHSPKNDESTIITYRVPHLGKWKGMIRLVLKPSLSRSSNSCYRVEYWEWNKILYPNNYNDAGLRPNQVTSKDKPSNTRKLLFTEYWYVPTVKETTSIDMRRVDSSPDFPYCDFIYNDEVVEVIDLIDENRIYWDDYEVKDLSYKPSIESLTNEVVTYMPAICWGQSHPRPNTGYTITVSKAVSHREILFLPEWDMRNRDTESTRENSTFHAYPHPLSHYLFPPFT